MRDKPATAGEHHMGASDTPAAESDAVLAAVLLAVAPDQLKGAVLYCDSRAVGELWTGLFHSLLPPSAPARRIPGNITDERLLGGLDFTSTLSRGAAVSERGLLAEADTGSVLLSASTARASTYAHVERVLDHAAVSLEREGLSERHSTRFAVVVTQTVDDEPVPASIVDRVAFHVPLGAGAHRALTSQITAEKVIEARQLFAQFAACDDALVALTRASARLGITSPRPVLLALAAARAHAALHSRVEVEVSDIKVASRLVLAPRAQEQSDESEPAPADDPTSASAANPQSARDEVADRSQPEIADRRDESQQPKNPDADLTEILIQSAVTALPAGLLTTFAARSVAARGSNGRAGNEVLRGVRGRQVGVRRGDPRGGARLDLVATLRAAIPMQRIRRNLSTNAVPRAVELRRDDFRIRQCVTPATTTALFVVDASGSSAMQRLAEAKGAVELMLAEGYSRRDRVALITFRGASAELVLPPTHALARARRAISGLPAGGGTPLATALDLAATVLSQLQRAGGQFVTIILTDGRANVARDGLGGRGRAMDEALEAATRLRSVCGNVVWVDTSSRSELASRQLAERANARYLLLPSPSANGLSDAVRAARPPAVA